MKLHNSLTKKLEDFKPTGTNISIYTCGPTVYEHLSIGNLRSFVFADTLNRTLRAVFPEASIDHVMNITDVDDKTIKGSNAKYADLPPKEALKKLTDHYTGIFIQDVDKVGIDIANTLQLEYATDPENIKAMQKLINKLFEDGFAYETEDGVYFSIEKYKESGKTYGQLTHIDTPSEARSRIDNDEYDKENAQDFALWKAQKGNEPSWDLTLDGKKIAGRPGWHIECSAMSEKELGLPIDIHTGGVDLIFPHHENEIAQSTAGRSDTFARFFLHNEHILIDGKKMSKSLGNFVTLDDVYKKGYDPIALRMMFLQSNYRNQLNFSWQNLESASNRLRNIYRAADLVFQPTESSAKLDEDEVIDEMDAALEHDLNTAEALVILNNFAFEMEKNLVNKETVETLKRILIKIDSRLGLNLSRRKDLDDGQKQLLANRMAAKDNKDFDKSDQIRDELSKAGIEVRDTPHGQIWSRK